MKDYSILVSSSSKISGSDASDFTYRFDWSLFGEGEYDLVDLVVPFSSDRYMTTTTGNASTTNVIGLIQMVGVDGFVDTTTDYAIRQWKSLPDNHTIRLYGRPMGNEFRVRLLQNNNSLAGHFPASYTLMLKLTKVR